MTDTTTETTPPRDADGRFTAPLDTKIEPLVSPSQFEPMLKTEKPEEKSYSGENSGLREAAADLVERRNQNKPPIIERAYHHAGGDRDGEPMAPNLTTTAADAADLLAKTRRAEEAAVAQATNDQLAKQVDEFRADAGQPPPTESLQPQPENAPPEAAANDLGQKFEQLPPELKTALEQQAMAAELARQQYAAAAQQLVLAAEGQLVASFPELKGANAQTLPAVLHGINSRDPARAQQIVQGIQAAAQHVQIAQAHQRQQAMAQQAQQAQQFEAYAKQQDDAFEEFERSRPASEVKQVRENIYDVLKTEFNVDASAIQQLYNSHPQFRSAQAQKLIYAAVRNVLAERGLKKARPNLPPVQKPGMAGQRGNPELGRAAALNREFLQNPTPRSAAKALLARRRAIANSR